MPQLRPIFSPSFDGYATQTNFSARPLSSNLFVPLPASCCEAASIFRKPDFLKTVSPKRRILVSLQLLLNFVRLNFFASSWLLRELDISHVMNDFRKHNKKYSRGDLYLYSFSSYAVCSCLFLFLSQSYDFIQMALDRGVNQHDIMAELYQDFFIYFLIFLNLH